MKRPLPPRPFIDVIWNAIQEARAGGCTCVPGPNLDIRPSDRAEYAYRVERSHQSGCGHVSLRKGGDA